jgi:cytochrome c-type biogenesis protein CcmH/NrfG
MIEAIISAAAAILVCMINNHCQNKRTEAQQKETINLVVYRLEQLEKKQDKYNNIIFRTYELEKNEAVLEEEMKVANHRIEDLEQFHKP